MIDNSQSKMKSFKSKVVQVTLVLLTVLSFSSCMNTKVKDTKELATDRNEEKFDNKSKKKDAKFLVNAVEFSLKEISLGQLAQERSTISHVKELGIMMETEHKKALADLSALAKAKNMAVPTSQTRTGEEAYDKLNKKDGNYFGTTYSDMMVTVHKDAIALFEMAAAECSDPDIRAWANATLPTLRTHLDRALLCQGECDKL
jgi:putative membrane protein